MLADTHFKRRQGGPESGRPAAHEAARAEAALEPDLRAHIGMQLRAAYDDILKRPVPDRFVALLDRLGQTRSDGE